MTEVTMLDMSAIILMESIVKDLQKRNIGMVINNLQSRMILKLRRAGIRKQAGKISFSRTLDEGLDAAQKML
jgi:SulP family sulfate permease